jgi:hypothetical protein
MLEIKQATECGWTQARWVEQHEIDWNSEGNRSRGRSKVAAKEAVLKEAT